MKKRALVVDDNEKNLVMEKDLLEVAGFEVFLARDASNGIAVAKKEKPDVIALGYDQKAYIKNLKKDLKNKGISVKIIRLKPYKEKTTLIFI